MKKYYLGKKLLLRSNMKIGTIIKKLNEKYLLSYYDDDNNLKYRIVDNDDDIIDDNEYEIIKQRINNINKII